MKAYEIKLTLENTNAPIYRVINVPSQINFDKLHKIFQIAAGFNDLHLYEFVFEQDNVSITNDEEGCDEYEYASTAIGKDHMEQLGMAIPKVSMFRAGDIFIEPLFKKYSAFTYIYDFADLWKHKVEVLSIIETPLEYAKITDYCGDFPPEDFGGTESLNDMLYVLSNPSLPEYDEMVKWCKERGFKRFDVQAANEMLIKLK